MVIVKCWGEKYSIFMDRTKNTSYSQRAEPFLLNVLNLCFSTTRGVLLDAILTQWVPGRISKKIWEVPMRLA